MNDTFLIIQSIISVLLIITILMQQRGTALGSAFGGSGGGAYSARRGAQKYIFWASVALTIAFIILSALNLLY